MSTAQIASDVESIKSQIKQALLYRGGVVTSTEGTMRSVQRLLGICCSGEKFDRAIGSLIFRGEVIRKRPEPDGRCDDDRPVTISLSTFSGGYGAYRGSFAR